MHHIAPNEIQQYNKKKTEINHLLPPHTNEMRRFAPPTLYNAMWGRGGSAAAGEGRNLRKKKTTIIKISAKALPRINLY